MVAQAFQMVQLKPMLPGQALSLLHLCTSYEAVFGGDEGREHTCQDAVTLARELERTLFAAGHLSLLDLIYTYKEHEEQCAAEDGSSQSAQAALAEHG